MGNQQSFYYVSQLAGGTAALQQMKERLEKDLMEVSISLECLNRQPYSQIC